jgi:quercetin dioxygenase-like cupin family protein
MKGSMSMSDAMILPHEIGAGKDREIQVLLADRWRKVVLIHLRQGGLLADHWARVPITIQTLAGKGRLRLGSEEHELIPGILIPVDAHVIHNVQGTPDVALLVSFFRQADPRDETDDSPFGLTPIA